MTATPLCMTAPHPLCLPRALRLRLPALHLGRHTLQLPRPGVQLCGVGVQLALPFHMRGGRTLSGGHPHLPRRQLLVGLPQLWARTRAKGGWG